MTLSLEEVREKNRVRLRQLRKDRPEWNNAKNARWKSANRLKYLAHKRVEKAIVSGRMIAQPCQRCGAVELVHAHHDDYAHPFDVMWLCPMHHRERHRELENNNMNDTTVTLHPGRIELPDGPTPYPSPESNVMVKQRTPRAATRRAYFIADSDTLEFRQGDSVVETIDLAGLSNDAARRACIEGIATTYLRGASKAAILDGSAFPDRSPPATARKNPGIWEQAIVAVRVKEWAAAERAAGRKPDRIARELCAEQAAEWVGTLTKDQIARAKTSAAVLAEAATIRGVTASLDDLLGIARATSEAA